MKKPIDPIGGETSDFLESARLREQVTRPGDHDQFGRPREHAQNGPVHLGWLRIQAIAASIRSASSGMSTLA